ALLCISIFSAHRTLHSFPTRRSSDLGAPHLMNFSVPGLKPEVMIHSLGESGIALSTKSACSSKQLDESRVLSACGFSERRSKSAFSVSMSYDTTKEDITIFLKEFKKTVRQLKEVMG